MSTSCVTYVHDESCGKQAIMALRRHADGYPRVHAKELCDFLSGLRLVNGLPVGDDFGLANGMGCLAAQMVAHFKTEPGQFYMSNPNGPNDYDDFVYEVFGRSDRPEQPLRLRIVSRLSETKTLYEGSVSDIPAWLAVNEES